MSEPVSALNGAVFNGGIADIHEQPPTGMISIRGDLGAAYLRKSLKKITGSDMPDTRGIAVSGGFALAWMSPDELLLVCPYGDVAAHIDSLRSAIGANHGLVVNVSDARALFRIKGTHVREVLAKLAPVDMAPGAFEPGTIRRTRLAQVPAAFWMVDAETAQLVCFRSVARYVFDLLSVAAQPGSKVEFFGG